MWWFKYDYSWLGSKCSFISITRRFVFKKKIIRNSLDRICFDVDSGIRVGRNTPYKYIVVNIHYLSILKNDNSGNQIIMSRKLYVYYENEVFQ